MPAEVLGDTVAADRVVEAMAHALGVGEPFEPAYRAAVVQCGLCTCRFMPFVDGHQTPARAYPERFCRPEGCSDSQCVCHRMEDGPADSFGLA